MDFNHFIDLLKSAMKKKLPGKEAQYQMISNRRLVKIKPDAQTKGSGVLILLYEKENEVHSVLIKRPESDEPHGGQISLPGGRFEENDKNLEATALRETCEEIGIEENEISIIGTLTTLYIPVSNYIVLPVVGYMKTPPVFKKSKDEVEYTIEFKLSRLLDDDVIKSKEEKIRDMPFTIRYFNIDGHVVWGATAMILNELVAVIQNYPSLKKFLQIQ